jgi:type IV pilus assembly protein PilE
MQRMSGFTLIELMIAMAIVALLAVVAFPSYQSYIQRGIRSSGQQYLMDLVQREEQYFLDNRAYAPTVVFDGTIPGPNSIAVLMPTQVAANYQIQNPVCAAPCTTYVLALIVVPGSTMSQSKNVSGSPSTDGDLYINNLQQRWREVDGNTTYNPKPASNLPGDCLWEDSHCVPG